ncbi:unannotated protein [freshwater metagenome]|uniref:Unannotated protein n=1 Tax=freshwater metagenome TaxID=449393 RepID=A0A6J7I1R2_9ZZZZ
MIWSRYFLRRAITAGGPVTDARYRSGAALGPVSGSAPTASSSSATSVALLGNWIFAETPLL